MLHKEKVPGFEVLVEVVAVVEEETPDPKNDEDPTPKWNVVLDPLRDEDDVLVEAPEFEGAEGPLVDEIG